MAWITAQQPKARASVGAAARREALSWTAPRGQELCRSRSARAEPGTLAPGNEGADASETESTDKPTVFLVQNRTLPVRLGRTQEAVVIGDQKAAHPAQELGFLLGQ